MHKTSLHYTTESTLLNGVVEKIVKIPTGVKNLKGDSDTTVPRRNACYQMETSASVLVIKLF
jgi:hypothetical protein